MAKTAVGAALGKVVMGAILIPILIVVVAVVALGTAAQQFVRRQRVRTDRIRAQLSTLRYEVPPGLDPAEVILELARCGYEVVPDATVGQSSEVLIGRRGDKPPDREEIRARLALYLTRVGAGDPPTSEAAQVRFMDEDTASGPR